APRGFEQIKNGSGLRDVAPPDMDVRKHGQLCERGADQLGADPSRCINRCKRVVPAADVDERTDDAYQPLKLPWPVTDLARELQCASSVVQLCLMLIALVHERAEVVIGAHGSLAKVVLERDLEGMLKQERGFLRSRHTQKKKGFGVHCLGQRLG